MPKYITRTIKFSRISCVEMVINDGVPSIRAGQDVILFSTPAPSRERATAIIRKTYGPDFSVLKITEETERYTMPLSEFMRHARRVTDLPPAEAAEALNGTDEDDDTPATEGDAAPADYDDPAPDVPSDTGPSDYDAPPEPATDIHSAQVAADQAAAEAPMDDGLEVASDDYEDAYLPGDDAEDEDPPF